MSRHVLLQIIFLSLCSRPLILTTSISLLSMVTASKGSGFRGNVILSSLHLSGLRTTLFLRDYSITSSVIPWALLTFPLWNTSEAVVSSTNFYEKGDWISKSLIIKTNNHGLNLVPCGTPEGTKHL